VAEQAAGWALRRACLALALALLWLAAGCSRSPDSPAPFEAAPATEEPQPEIAYRATIEGVEDAALRKLATLAEAQGLRDAA